MNKKSNNNPITGIQLKNELKKLEKNLSNKILGVDNKLSKQINVLDNKLSKQINVLDNKLDQREMSLRTEIRITAEETKKEIKEKFAGLVTKEEICQFKDDIITELVKIRETTDILLGRYPQM